MLSVEQREILRNMLFAMLIALILAVVSILYPLNNHLNRVESYLLALILPTCSYVIGIGRIASLRFFDESVSNPLLAADNIKLNTLKQYLSNTHEQLFLALIAYALLSWTLPIEHIYLVFLFSVCFVLGRLLFANGYSHGAGGRSLGFALTFYSNVIGFVIGLVFLLKNII
jgi:uncharacterized membrane protein YecN with MAPEG domain